MNPKFEHLMDEADIGSGEKTPAELADLKETEQLREQKERARQQQHPLDGGSLLQVTEEQQYIAQHESHTPPEEGSSVEKTEMLDTDKASATVPVPADKDLGESKKSRRGDVRQESVRPRRPG